MCVCVCKARLVNKHAYWHVYCILKSVICFQMLNYYSFLDAP